MCGGCHRIGFDILMASSPSGKALRLHRSIGGSIPSEATKIMKKQEIKPTPFSIAHTALEAALTSRNRTMTIAKAQDVLNRTSGFVFSPGDCARDFMDEMARVGLLEYCGRTKVRIPIW